MPMTSHSSQKDSLFGTDCCDYTNMLIAGRLVCCQYAITNIEDKSEHKDTDEESMAYAYDKTDQQHSPFS